MKVVVRKTSDYSYMTVKEFHSLEALFGFIDKCGHSLIIEKNQDKGCAVSLITEYNNVTVEEAKEISKCDFSVEIYDDWRE